jgi:hypothetical protein
MKSGELQESELDFMPHDAGDCYPGRFDLDEPQSRCDRSPLDDVTQHVQRFAHVSSRRISRIRLVVFQHSTLPRLPEGCVERLPVLRGDNPGTHFLEHTLPVVPFRADRENHIAGFLFAVHIHLIALESEFGWQPDSLAAAILEELCDLAFGQRAPPSLV